MAIYSYMYATNAKLKKAPRCRTLGVLSAFYADDHLPTL